MHSLALESPGVEVGVDPLTLQQNLHHQNKDGGINLCTLKASDYVGVGEGDSTMSVLVDLMVECIKVLAVTLHKLEKP